MSDTIEGLLDTYGDDLDHAIDEGHTPRVRPNEPQRRGPLLAFAAACALIAGIAAVVVAGQEDQTPTPAVADDTSTIETDSEAPAVPTAAIAPLFGGTLPGVGTASVTAPDGTTITIATEEIDGQQPIGGPYESFDHPQRSVCVIGGGWGPCLIDSGEDTTTVIERGAMLVVNLGTRDLMADNRLDDPGNTIGIVGTTGSNVATVVATDGDGGTHSAATVVAPGLPGTTVFHLSFPGDLVTRVDFLDDDGQILGSATCAAEGLSSGGRSGPRMDAQLEQNRTCE